MYRSTLFVPLLRQTFQSSVLPQSNPFENQYGSVRNMSWVDRFKSVRTMPLNWDYKKAMRYDWDAVRQEVFKDLPSTHSHQAAPDGTSMGDQAAPNIGFYVPPADGFPELHQHEEDIPPPLQSVIETSTFTRRAHDPTPPRLPLVRTHGPDGKTHVGYGRRKSSAASVFVTPGEGLVTINGRPLHEYFDQWRARDMSLSPLIIAEQLGKFDVRINCHGGGTYGQAGAISLALSKALSSFNPAYAPTLRAAGLSKRDPRVVERKKIGKKKARKAKQWSKR